MIALSAASFGNGLKMLMRRRSRRFPPDRVALASYIPRGASQRRRLSEVAGILRGRYSDFAHHNRRNPLDELLYIICSTQTDEDKYLQTFRGLRKRFPSFDALSSARNSTLIGVLRSGGLYRQKARMLRAMFQMITEAFGKLTLAPLKTWSDSECEAFLRSLPGVGTKVARCVMMYSLDRQVFPVDIHCWRIARRLGGLVPEAAGNKPSNRDMDQLQAKIAPELRFSLHVNFVALGREFCRAKNPLCYECPLRAICRRIGVEEPSQPGSDTPRRSSLGGRTTRTNKLLLTLRRLPANR